MTSRRKCNKEQDSKFVSSPVTSPANTWELPKIRAPNMDPNWQGSQKAPNKQIYVYMHIYIIYRNSPIGKRILLSFGAKTPLARTSMAATSSSIVTGNEELSYGKRRAAGKGSKGAQGSGQITIITIIPNPELRTGVAYSRQ